MSSFVIKLIAILTMISDHTNDAIIGHLSIFNLFGRIAFPLFSFQLVVGYSYTKDIKKYITRMFIFALISQVPYCIFMHLYTGTYFALNIFFTLASCLICMYIISSKQNIFLKILYIAIISAISYFLKFDYTIWGILYTLFIFMFYPFQDKLGKNHFYFPQKSNKNLTGDKILVFLSGTLVFSIVKYWSFLHVLDIKWLIGLIISTFIPSVIMLMFNGKKGPAMKYFFYTFYPLHITILDLYMYFFK